MSDPRCIIIAGPNGSGKTTFAREFLPKDGGVIHFVNADLLAAGLSPLKPELAALAAGRLFLTEMDRLAKARLDFSFETTLSGLTYLHRIKSWKAPVTSSRWSIFGSRPRSWPYAVSRAASDKVGTTFRAQTSCVVLNVAGPISLISTACLPILGACMITQGTDQS